MINAGAVVVTLGFLTRVLTSTRSRARKIRLVGSTSTYENDRNETLRRMMFARFSQKSLV